MGIITLLAGFLAIFIGMAVGILGGGGSILTTPLLVYVVGFDAKQAITASLFVVLRSPPSLDSSAMPAPGE